MKRDLLSLPYLLFERVEDGLGGVTLEAMVSVRPERVEAVMAEWRLILDGARSAFATQEGPLDEGGWWDHACSGRFSGDGWHEMVFTLVGNEAFADALARQWE